MIRLLMTASLLACAATPALAQSASGDWSFAVGAATDNRSKDASKSDGSPYVWGQGEWSSASGLVYGGGGFETIEAGGSDVELEVSGGLRPQLGGFDLELDGAYKYRVDADAGYDHDAWEFTADVKRSIGPAGARVRLQHSPDGTGSTKAWTWIAGRIGWDFTPKLTGTAEVGRREQDAAVDYTGWNVGFTYAATQALEVELRYHATDAEAPGEQYADALVAGVSFAF